MKPRLNFHVNGNLNLEETTHHMVNSATWNICTILRVLPVPAGETDKWLKLLRHICGKYAPGASD